MDMRRQASGDNNTVDEISNARNSDEVCDVLYMSLYVFKYVMSRYVTICTDNIL